MKIGIIGCGNIGSTLARLWARAGHQVVFSSRHPDQLVNFAREVGPNASVGTPEEAAQNGEVILLSIPLGEVPKLSVQVRNALRGKIVMDTCNPYPERDGEAANEVFRGGKGTGVWTAKQLPGARIVRAFNSVPAQILQSAAHRPGEPVGVPLASDDRLAMRTVSTLVRDAGFGPVIVGDLKRAKDFDPNTRPFTSGASQAQLEEMLGLKKAG